MEYISCVLIGYLAGVINPAYLIGKKKGFDIRKKGSGNAGASNALILFGKLAGALCAIFDIAKAYFAVWLTQTLFPASTLAYVLTGISCVLGHIFPFYMKFKGGKGLACLGGIIMFFDWRVFLIMLAAEVVIALLTDYVCFVPITASAVFPILYGIMTLNPWGTLLLLIIPIVIFLRHIENIHRIRAGTEMRLSYLWKPDAEMARMKNNLPADASAVDEHFTGGSSAAQHEHIKPSPLYINQKGRKP